MLEDLIKYLSKIIRVDIQKAIDSSPDLRHKKKLIGKFIIPWQGDVEGETEITQILQPIPLFSKIRENGLGKNKQTAIAKLKAFFDSFLIYLAWCSMLSTDL